jgi:hypothetical protein
VVASVLERSPVSAEGDAAYERYVLPEVDVMLRVARSLTRGAQGV